MPIASINNQGIFYEDTGNADKPALIFMHGFLFNQAMFDPQVEALKDDYRCVRFDARALGQTEWDGEPFTLYDTVADCIGLMDHLSIEKATMVGMSQGGYAALRVALKHQERVDALILMSTSYHIDNEEFKNNYRTVRDVWKENDAAPEPILNNMLTLFLGAQDQYQHLWDIWKPEFEKIKGNQVFHGMNNLLERDEITPDDLATISVPTLVTHGKDDIGMPSHLGQAIFDNMPTAKKIALIPNAAHAANLMEPAMINEEIATFLKETVYA